MKMLLVGTGGVGEAIVKILRERDREGKWLEKVVMTSTSSDRAKKLADFCGDSKRFIGEQLDAHDKSAIVQLAKKHGCDFVMDASVPYLTNNIFDAAFEAGCNYMNMGTWSDPGEAPYDKGMKVMMGEYNFARHGEWEKKKQLALLGMGIDPGVVDVFAKFAAKHLFDELDEIHVRDGSNIEVEGSDISFGFNVWTVLDECLNPNLEWRRNRGFSIDKPFSGKEIFDFPDGVGMQKVYKIEHEEVVFMPRYLEKYGLKHCDFKISLDDNLVNALKVIEMLGLRDMDRTVKIGGIESTPRDIIARLVEQPTDIAERMNGKMCVGIDVTGKKDGKARNIFLYQTLDQEESMKRLGCQAVVAQTGYGAAVAIELLAKGIWQGMGVHAPEYFEPEPYLNLMEEMGFPYSFCEWDSDFENTKAKEYFHKFLQMPIK